MKEILEAVKRAFIKNPGEWLSGCMIMLMLSSLFFIFLLVIILDKIFS